MAYQSMGPKGEPLSFRSWSLVKAHFWSEVRKVARISYRSSRTLPKFHGFLSRKWGLQPLSYAYARTCVYHKVRVYMYIS